MSSLFIFFFFNDTATTEIYPLSLHDALPISVRGGSGAQASLEVLPVPQQYRFSPLHGPSTNVAQAYARFARDYREDRKSTRLNSSHDQISYAVFCLKKKKKTHHYIHDTKISV